MENVTRKITMTKGSWKFLQDEADQYGVSRSMVVSMLLNSRRIQQKATKQIINDEIKAEL